MSALVLGHMNPDTDSIVSAIVAADLYSKRGMDVTPVAQGAPTPETEFVLKKFGIAAPQVVADVAGKDVVEAYFNPPYTEGGIEKSAVNLVAYDKTELLAPGASQTITVTFDDDDMAPFPPASRDVGRRGFALLTIGRCVLSGDVGRGGVTSGPTWCEIEMVRQHHRSTQLRSPYAAYGRCRRYAQVLVLSEEPASGS